MEATEGLLAIGRAVAIARSLRSAISSDDAVNRVQLGDLIEALVDAKGALVDAKEELATARAAVKGLREHLEAREQLVLGRDGYKYRRGADGQVDGYPACPHCEQVVGRIIFLVPDGHWQKGVCPACDKRFAPIYPHNSLGEREEQEQKQRSSKAMRDYGERLAGAP